MSSAFHHLALADVRPGMVLSDVLLDRQGQVLLPQGAVLTEAIIALLPRHGIEALAVLGAGDDASTAPPPDLAALEQRLAHLFRKHDTGVADSLRHYIEDYRLDREIAP